MDRGPQAASGGGSADQPPVISRVLSLHGVCNNHCLDCLCRERGSALRPAERLLQEARAARPWFDGFLLTDGEPTLVPDLPGLLSDLAALSPRALQVHTNARRFAYRGYLRPFLELPGLDLVVRVFSVDPEIHDRLTRCPGSAEQTWVGLRALARRRPAHLGLRVEVPVTAAGASHLAETVAAVAALEPDAILLTGGHPAARSTAPAAKVLDGLLPRLAPAAGRTPLRSHYLDRDGPLAPHRLTQPRSRSGRRWVGPDHNGPLVFRCAGTKPVRTLLLYLPYNTEPGSDFLAAPHSLGTLKGFLSTLGYPCDLGDLEAESRRQGVDFAPVLQRCRAGDPVDEQRLSSTLAALLERWDLGRYEVVGLSLGEQFAVPVGLALARLLSREAPDAVRVAGCVRRRERDVFGDRLHYLCETPIFGEYYLGGLCNRLEHGDRSRFAIYRNEARAPRHPIERHPAGDLRRLPPLDFSTLDVSPYRRPPSSRLTRFLRARGHPLPPDPGLGVAMFCLSRGCRFRCAYCHGNEIYLPKDPERAALELVAIYRATGLRGFHFTDGSLNNSRPLLERFCDALIRQGEPVLWSASARATFRHPDLPRKLRAAGCVLLTYGLESGSDRTLRRMRKGYTAAAAARGLRLAAEAGLVSRVNLMTGYPGETPQDVAATREFLSNHGPLIDLLSYHGQFQWHEGLGVDPADLGVILREAIQGPMGRARAFDEIDGRPWSAIQAFQREAHAAIEKSVAELRRVSAIATEHDVFHVFAWGGDRALFRDYLASL